MQMSKTQTSVIFWISIMFLVLGLNAGAETNGINVPRCDQAPKMDGRLTEDCWKNAAVLKDFTVVGKGMTTDTTECRLTMDDTWLYFGFRCKNPGMSQIDQKEKERDGSVSADDSVEVYFDPGTDGALFFQFMLSFANVQADRMHTQKDGMNASWDLPWRSATKVEKDGWTAEMAIPLFLIASYGDPAKVRLNVARNERRIILDPYGAKLSEERTANAWSPILKSYAEPDKFRPLTGFDGLKIGVPEMIGMEGAEVGGYELSADARGYTVKVRLRSYTGKGGKAIIEVVDRPISGTKVETVAMETAVKPMQAEEYILRMPVKTLVRRDVVVTLKETGGGAVLRELMVKEPAVLNLMGEALTDRNYYTTEKEARVRLRIGLPEAELKDKTLIVKLADGKVLVKSKIAIQDIESAIPLKKVPLGENSLTVALEDAKGAVVVEGKTVLTKRVPKPGCEVKVDQFNRVVLKDGKPFFPFGLNMEPPSANLIKQASKADYSAVFAYGYLVATTNLTQMIMPVARDCGLDVLVDRLFPNLSAFKEAFDAFSTFPRDATHQKRLLEAVSRGMENARQPITDDIRAVRDFPNLIGYYNVDEPNLNNSEAEMFAARMVYKWIHQEDGYRPVYTCFARSIPKGGTDVGDVLMYDVYVYPGWRSFYSCPGPGYMTVEMLKLKKRADSVNKPAMMVPMAEAMDPGRTPRAMLPEEQFCQTYLAVIHGAKGLIYYCHRNLYTQYMWDTLAELARQMKVIGPAAVSGEVYPVVRYAPVDMNADKEVYPDVQATLFKNPAGGYLLLAANTALYPVDVKYNVPGIAKADVRRLFQEQKFKADQDGFADRLEPYGVRAYALELLPEAAKPVKLALELTAHPDQAKPFKIFNPAEDFKNRKNCAANPSFEDVTAPGLPDWVRPCMPPSWPLIGAPGAVGLTLDPINPVHGKVSLRETIPLPAALGQRGITGMCYIPNTDKPVPVVFSAYIKASANVKQVYLSVNGIVSEESYHDKGLWEKGSYFKSVKPSTEWQRVTFKGMLDPSRMEYKSVSGDRLAVVYSIGPGNMGNLAVAEKTGQADFWVDAVQLEIGDQATEFSTE